MKSTFFQAPIWLTAQKSLAQWYATGLGQSILDELEFRLSDRLTDVFGYQGLIIGNFDTDRDLLAHAGLHRKLTLDAPGQPADINADVLHLPIASDSMKLVVFFHTLDFCDQPHQALREADRVLMDDGQLIIIGFNPLSGFGVRHLLTGWRNRPPWNGRFYSRMRLKDWLSVLSYRVLHSRSSFIRPPINSETLLRRLRRLESLRPWLGGIGGLYIMQARKQTVPMTLSRQQWRGKRKGIPVGTIARTADQVSRNKSKPPKKQ